MHKKTDLRIPQPCFPTARERQRGGFVWTCTLGLSLLYLGFLVLVAFQPEWLGAPLSTASSTLFWGLGLLLLLLTFVLATLHFNTISRDHTGPDNSIPIPQEQ